LGSPVVIKMTTDAKLDITENAPDAGQVARPFSVGRIVRLSTFQIGSAMGDIFTAGVWNRIMISDFGIPAWPVGLLLALRYFMSPISLWVGNRSDTIPLWNWYRTSYIWLGRGLMLLSFPLLGASTVMLEQDTGALIAWSILIVSFLMYGLGTLLSGSPYLALVRDSAPPAKQGIAIGIVETALITLFPIVAIGFSRMLTRYDPALFWRLILFVMVVGGFFWYFSVAGAEKENRRWTLTREVEGKVDLGKTFQMIWADGRTRIFFLFLFMATFSAWMQDNVLEPFGADVFDWRVEQTTRLTGYWGTATVVVLIASFVIWRNRRPEEGSGVTKAGLAIMALGMALLFASAFAGNTSIFLTGLVIFGAGFGLYTFGGLSLMAVMSPDPHSGAYLGLWTVAILVSKGLGTFMGGVIRDVFLAAGAQAWLAYGAIFALSAVGLLAAAGILSRLDVVSFARDTGRQGVEKLPLASVEM
jgi:BCD family chlorophyll transporter-like MFS transporter